MPMKETYFKEFIMAAATTVAAYAAVTAAVAGSYGASEQHKAGTSQKHARKRALLSQAEAGRKSEAEARMSKQSAKLDKMARSKGVSANRGLFSDPLGIGGQANVIKKSLTGN